MSGLPEVAVTESLLGDGVTDELPPAPAVPTSATQRASARRRDAVRTTPLAHMPETAESVIEQVAAEMAQQRAMRDAIPTGWHPLSRIATGDVPELRLHSRAPRSVHLVGCGIPFTCGSCRHRLHHHGHSWDSCALGPASTSMGTRLQPSWPACTRYETTDQAEEATP